MGKAGFALWRLPYEKTCLWVQGDVEELNDCRQLDGCEGFVLAPFVADSRNPIALIVPEVRERVAVDNVGERFQKMLTEQFWGGVMSADCQAAKRENSYPFDLFYDRLQAGDFQKIVLARSQMVAVPENASPFSFFRNACENYPRLLVALVYTPMSGLWLMATPEVLLEGRGREWSTMALAGTMRLTEEQVTMNVPRVKWNAKNQEEQRLVAHYIYDCLRRFSDDVQEQGPYTSRAAHLVHLRSDFTFTLSDASHLGSLLAALHPTPAVCGLPKQATCDFIVANESFPRRYYSGFVGQLSPSADTHLYVSLRCMQIHNRFCRLYAGGGLLKDSQWEKEWAETNAKMETMLKIIK